MSGKTKHEIIFERNKNYPFSSTVTDSFQFAERTEKRYSELCKQQKRVWVSGHETMITLQDGTVENGWKIGYCRNVPKGEVKQ